MIEQIQCRDRAYTDALVDTNLVGLFLHWRIAVFPMPSDRHSKQQQENGNNATGLVTAHVPAIATHLFPWQNWVSTSCVA